MHYQHDRLNPGYDHNARRLDLYSTILCIEYFEKIITGILTWCAVWFLIPKILFFAGMRFESLRNISLWFPYNLFAVINGQHVNTGECVTAWSTAEGMTRCIISGAAGTLLFALTGIFLLKRKDL